MVNNFAYNSNLTFNLLYDLCANFLVLKNNTANIQEFFLKQNPACKKSKPHFIVKP